MTEQYLVDHGFKLYYKGSQNTFVLNLPRKSKVRELLAEVWKIFHGNIKEDHFYSNYKELKLKWKLRTSNKFLKLDDVAPYSVQLWTGGLNGGKGGFGAMLRAAAKQSGNKMTKDFGACRDLQGRRLRHVNNEIRLRKWFEEHERIDQLNEIAEEKTPSGIDNWYLGVPSWAEGVGNQGKQSRSYLKPRRKTSLCKQWLQARENSIPPDDAPIWWGCPRGRGCDFAHGEDELRGSSGEEFKKRKAEEVTQMKAMAMETYLNYAVSDNFQESMTDAVHQGLFASRAAKKQKNLKKTTEKYDKIVPLNEELVVNSTSCVAISIDYQEQLNQNIGVPLKICSWLGVLCGDANLTEEGEVYGMSEFASVFVRGIRLKSGKWYYEVKLLTDGVIQIGWANQKFKGNSVEGNGIGDDLNSWSYDGSKQICLNGEVDERSQNYGFKWKVGDVVGCFFDVDAGTISYSLNGIDMEIAFRNINMKLEDSDQIDSGYFPAISLEFDEKVQINGGLHRFSFLCAEGFRPIYDAMIPDPKTCEEKITEIEVPAENIVDVSDAVTLEPNGFSIISNGSSADVLLSTEQSPLDLSNIETASDLHKYGLERLKKELQERGVKCGGTLDERSARLFELRNLAPSMYPERLLATKNGKNKTCERNEECKKP